MPRLISLCASAVSLAIGGPAVAEPMEATLIAVEDVDVWTTTADGELFAIAPTVSFSPVVSPDGRSFWAGGRLTEPGADGLTSHPGLVRLDLDSLEWRSMIYDVELGGFTAVDPRLTRSVVSNHSIATQVALSPSSSSPRVEILVNWNPRADSFAVIGITDETIADQADLPRVIRRSPLVLSEREPGRVLFDATMETAGLFTHQAGVTAKLLGFGEPIPGYPDLFLARVVDVSDPDASGRLLFNIDYFCTLLLTESDEWIRIACKGDPSPIGDPYASVGGGSASVGSGGLRAFDDGSLVFPAYIDRGNPPNFDLSIVYRDADGDQILLRTGGPKFPGTDHRQWKHASFESRTGWMAVELSMAPWNGAPEHRDVALLHGKAPNLAVAYTEGDLLPGSTTERWARTDYDPVSDDPEGPFSIQEVSASGDLLFEANVEVDGVVEQRQYIRNGQTGELRRAPLEPMIVSRTAVPGNWTFEPTRVVRMFDDGSLLYLGGATRLEPGAQPLGALARLSAASGTPCNAADVQAPRGVLDLSDADVFISAFITQNPLADIAAPFGLFDLDDTDAFIAAFLAGCP
ncbi:MAG: GC-type dockerin domain-anchored protein [Planctomycetota bacterium]